LENLEKAALEYNGFKAQICCLYMEIMNHNHTQAAQQHNQLDMELSRQIIATHITSMP
jgi:hypothetical protein